MANSVTIKTLSRDITFTIKSNSETQIYQLLEYIQNIYNINSDIKNWTCYSELQGKFLDHISCIGDTKNDKFTINTQPKQLQNQNFVYVANEPKDVIIQFEIRDGMIKRYFSSVFKSNDTLQNLLDVVKAYLGFDYDGSQFSYHCKLFYFENLIRDSELSRTIERFSIRNYTTLRVEVWKDYYLPIFY